MEAKIANVFRSNRSQAVRLPKAAEFPPEVTEVEVIVEGNTRVLVPARKKGKDWAAYFARPTTLSEDFSIDDRDLLQPDDVSFDD
ncbi:MAG: AbrB/MazE/SpoVT family DNA-binding domain-containing protein [Devosia nanyangense]|uniref:AbrB/MazE/SpoVT family DNA-binding domain-containing protein n=1 Tax=Devosia nanyangense TaxID=1228055 RepID=A0A933NZY0_9HYPH|nr:AbrB/MazE/SpoVT family DNA-binding domain-containing protein [Devosia nanyangense]